MTEFRVKWCECPHVAYSPRVLFVRANNADDAKKIARDHVERRIRDLLVHHRGDNRG